MYLYVTRMYLYVNRMYSCGVAVTICLCRPDLAGRPCFSCFSCWKCLRKRRNMWNCSRHQNASEFVGKHFCFPESRFCICTNCNVSWGWKTYGNMDKKTLKKVNFENYNMRTDINFFHYYSVKIYHYTFKVGENFCISIPDQPEFQKLCSALEHWD